VRKFEIDAPFYPNLEDFTFYEKVGNLKKLFAQPAPENLTDERQRDEAVRLRPRTAVMLEEAFQDGRLHLSRCFGGEFASLTFRATGKPVGKCQAEYLIRSDVSKSEFNPDQHKRKRAKTPPTTGPQNPIPEVRFLTPFESICEVLYKRIFPESLDVRGLILITGSTASGKSNIARGLIYKYLAETISRANAGRRPHFVTFEDPIDKYWAATPIKAALTGIDYTPREKGKDVLSLRHAVEAALRQTPKIFFVGETREPDDWKEILRFASTGHLCITTSHAGSLTESMGQILVATGASTPALRSDVAKRLLAIVHLRTRSAVQADENKDKAQIRNINLPALWVRSAVSSKALMADGLGSILPYQEAEDDGDSGEYPKRGVAGKHGCLGRSWFADRFLDAERASVGKDLRKTIKRLALGWDLEGL
jgi:hypothetical protein